MVETSDDVAPQPRSVAEAGSRRLEPRVLVVGGVALAATLAAGIGIGTLIGARTPIGEGTAADRVAPSTPAPSTTTTPATSAVAATTSPPPLPTPTAAAYGTPTKDDFRLKVKVLRKQCFGSAGCNVNFRVDVTYTGAELDPSTTYEVTYQVKGAEDPIVNTFEVTGSSASVESEESTSTARSGDRLTAVVTSVSEY
ncbi:hypothetical protein ABT336_04310 [Micromonospora sp. NPDC000207]|uniref:hypothetical protein n=1 Tax=Micromonospora sp. NPDC000207 TaxID=3154246 RepID=UPI003327CF69